MRFLRKLRNGERGFTLTETLTSITVFSVMTVGIAPLMGSAIKGTGLSRSYTVAKNFGAEAMERVRGFAYFESTKGASSPAREDVLDLYFPDRTAGGSSGYDGSTGSFTTICSGSSKLPATSAPQACPANIPPGYTATFVARFVKPGATPAPGEKQIFTTVSPPSNYSWNAIATEAPPTQLLEMTITITWTFGPSTKTYRVKTLIGPRVASDEVLRGKADLDYVIRTRTALVDASARTSTLTATGGTAASNIGIRGVAGADQTSKAGELELVRDSYESAPGMTVEAVTLADLFGATYSAHAPVNSGPTSVGPDAAQTLTHPDLIPPLSIAYLDQSTADNNLVQVTGGQPKAVGGFGYNPGLGQPSYWVNNQSDTASTALMHLDPTRRALSLTRLNTSGLAGAGRLTGTSSAESFDLTALGGGRVETGANANFGKLVLLPVTFIGSGDASVVTVSDFRADVDCTAVASTGTASATGSWSATFTYFADSNPNDGLSVGAYQSLPISGFTSGAGTGQDLSGIGNPLVYDAPLAANDVYLFETGTTNGYFKEIQVSTSIPSTVTADGSTASVDLAGAIQINTKPTNPAVNGSSLNIAIGKMSCSAVDNR